MAKNIKKTNGVNGGYEPLSDRESLQNKYKALEDQLNEYYKREENLNLTKKKKYDLEILEQYKKANEPAKIAEDDEEAKQLRERANQFATGSSCLVAFSEACLADLGIIGMLLLMPHVTLPLVVTVGVVFWIAGFVANYYLFRSDTERMLLWLWGKPKAGDDTQAVDSSTSIMQKIGFIFALGSGISCGALSLTALHSSIFVPLFLKMGLSMFCAAGLGWGFAILPALFTTVAITAIFSQMVSKFVKDISWMSITEYFKNTYYPDYYSEFTFEEKLGHWFLHVPIHFLKLVIGLAIAAIVSVVSFGVFHTGGVQLLRMMTCSARLAHTVFYVPALLYSIQNFIFGVEKMFTMSKLLTARGIVGGLAKFPVFLVDFLARLIISAIRIPILLIPYCVQALKPGLFGDEFMLLQWHLGWFTEQRDAYYTAVDAIVKDRIRGETFCDLDFPEIGPGEPSDESLDWWKSTLSCLAVLLNSTGYAALALPHSALLHMGTWCSRIITQLSGILFSAPQSAVTLIEDLRKEREARLLAPTAS